MRNLQVLLVLGFSLLLVRSGYGSETVCASIFYTDGRGINKMEGTLWNLCQDAIKNKAGCVQCFNGTVNGQYGYEKGIDFSRICWGSSNPNCDSTYSGDIVNDFTTFIQDFKDEGFKKIDILGNLEFKDIKVEKEETLTDSAITVTLVSHRKGSFTYNISSNVDFPIQCYRKTYEKSEAPESKRYFARNDTYILLTPKAKDITFTSPIPSGVFDCKTYQLSFKCYPIPYQYTVQKNKEFLNKLEITHTQEQAAKDNKEDPPTTESSACKTTENNEELIIKDENEREPEPLPTLATTDPQNDYTAEVEAIKQKSISEQVTSIKDLKNEIKSEISSSSKLTQKANALVKANSIIENISCESGEFKEGCIQAKKDLLTEGWKEINTIVNKGDISKSLGVGSSDSEQNIKIILQIIITSTNNNQYLTSSTASIISETLSSILSSSKTLLEGLNNSNLQDKEDVIDDIISLMTSAASATFQIADNQSIDGISKKIIDYTGKNKQLYKTIKSLSETLIQFNKRSASTNYYSFLYAPIVTDQVLLGGTSDEKDSRRRTLQAGDGNVEESKKEEEAPYDPYNTYVYDDVQIGIPLDYIRKNHNNTELGLSLFSYSLYPLVTTKGKNTFSQKVLSVNLVKNTTKGVKAAKAYLPKDLPIRLVFRNSTEVENFQNCYRYNPGSNKFPSFDNVFRETENFTKDGTVVYNQEYIICNSYKFGDFLIGAHNPNVNGVGIFFIVVFIINSIFWGLGIYWVAKQFMKRGDDKIKEPPSDAISEKVKVAESKGSARITSRSSVGVLQSESGFGARTLKPKKINIRQNSEDSSKI